MSLDGTWDQYHWRTSRLGHEELVGGHLFKGLLAVGPRDGSWLRYIPYGGHSSDPFVAVEKAVSERVERMTWFVSWQIMKGHGFDAAKYNTVGWAAHMTEVSARRASLGEYLERHFLESIIAALLGSSDSENILHSAIEVDSTVLSSHLGTIDFSFHIPMYLAEEKIYLSFVIIGCRLRDNDAQHSGLVFGMGHASRLDEATSSAKVEAYLVATAVRNSLGGKHTRKNTENLAYREAAYFSELYSNPLIYGRALDLFGSMRSKVHVNDQEPLVPVRVPGHATLDLSSLQASWLRQLSRRVCYTGNPDAAQFQALLSVCSNPPISVSSD